MIPLESQLCPQKLSKQIVELGGIADSYFKWVHSQSKEKEEKYIYTEWFYVYERKSYPAYTIGEILHELSEGYTLAQYSKKWYCKYSEDEWSNTIFYKSAIEACAYAYIRVLKENKKE